MMLRVSKLMRLTWTILAVFVFAACGALLPASSSASVQLQGNVPTHYTYRLQWSPQDRILAGRGEIQVRNNGPADTRFVWLRMRPNHPFQIERMKALRGATIAEYRSGHSMVKLRLSAPLTRGHRALFAFSFRLSVPRDRTSLGRAAGMDLFGDALPVVSVAGPDGRRLGHEPSYGEGSFNPTAGWNVNLSVPRGLRVVMPGRQLISIFGERRRVYHSVARVRDYAFAVGRSTEIAERVDGVRIVVVAPPTLRGERDQALRRAVKAFKQLERWYGDYNQPTLKIVLGNLSFGGSEYPGLVFSTPDNATIAHEVAHQWFYGMVGNDQYNDPFLDESLTAFSEQRFHKSYRCDLARPVRGRHGLGTGMEYWEKHAKAYEDTIYRGGACALTVLRRDIGAKTFDGALRAYVAANKDQIAGVDDFLAAIRAAAPWYDLARWEKLVGL